MKIVYIHHLLKKKGKVTDGQINWGVLSLINLKEMMAKEVIPATPCLPPPGSLARIDKPLLLLYFQAETQEM